MSARCQTAFWTVARQLLSVAFIGSIFLFTVADAEESSFRAALESITANEVQGHLQFLADDSLEGREAGSRGGHAAAGYLAAAFERAGLEARGDKNSYFQGFGNGMRNVIGVLKGSDPVLKDEFVLFGAHYDHVGYGNRRTSLGPFGFVHNGADDNASGTSALLELVDAFTRLPQPPKRSVLFVFWDGEEQGLLGSRHWVTQPTVPLKNVVFAFNIDMVGRLREKKVEVFGTRSSRGLRQLISRHNREYGLEMDFTWEMQANSDHHTLYAQSIPVLMVFTGIHEDYHRPSDDVDKINSDGVAAITRLLFSVGNEVTESGFTSGFRTGSRNENPTARRSFEKSYAPPAPRLGITWEMVGDQLLVRNVVPNSAAARIGIRVGDQIVGFNNHPVASEQRLRIEILGAVNPVSLTVRRNQETVELSGNLNGDAVRVGLAWREDDGEPGTVMVTQVISGSAAQLAGIRERDRIYEIAGRRFENGNEFQNQLMAQPAPLELLVERNGRIFSATLDVEPLLPVH